jgi:hypothetical protein
MPGRPASDPPNPFYVVLVLAGLLFVLTACGYFVMALRESSPYVLGGPDGAEAGLARHPHGLTDFLARHGVKALIAELAVLGAATLGAILTDDYWTRRRRSADRGRSGHDHAGEHPRENVQEQEQEQTHESEPLRAG